MRPVIVATLLGLAVALFAAACNGGASPEDETPAPPSRPPLVLSPTQAELPLRVAVTIPLFAEFAREMGGDNVEVFSLLPPGADPHTYQLTPSDISRISQADIFFVNGLGLDAAVQDLIEKNRSEGAKVIPFGPNLPSPRAAELGDINITADEAGDDPHLWLDPIMARTYADLMSDTFTIVDSVNRGFYESNLSAYSDRLLELNEEIGAQLQLIPRENRKLVTYHDSFVHFARRYDLDILGFAVLVPGLDPGPEEIARLTEAINDGGVPAVFAEVGFDSSALEEVASEAGIRVCTLYSSVQDESVSTYVDMMRANVDELVRCLGGADGG
jgi:ABC-type Zn uptake system ZnuABC Zn-binding protein ZnuA